jgi:8-oxo-dGTP pyrophosphatase MutT (NUDIX family)
MHFTRLYHNFRVKRKVREYTHSLIQDIVPLDKKEEDDRADALAWIASGAPLYRIVKPDVLNKHIVSYFAIFHPETNKILLQDHLLAHLWLPAGGHVDPDEDPADTVRREIIEELGIEADFLHDKPQFITVTRTQEQGQHTDVSLWYAVKGDPTAELVIEPGKFAEVRWWDIDEVLASPIEQFDPELHRFLKKLKMQQLI